MQPYPLARRCWHSKERYFIVDNPSNDISCNVAYAVARRFRTK